MTYTDRSPKGKERFDPTKAKRDVKGRIKVLEWRLERHTIDVERARLMNEYLEAMEEMLKGMKDD